jgi:hypothetical protein
MCLACQMEDELWFAYLDHVAQQQKQAAGQVAGAAAGAEATPASAPPKPEIKPAPATPFVCEEQPSE